MHLHPHRLPPPPSESPEISNAPSSSRPPPPPEESKSLRSLRRTIKQTHAPAASLPPPSKDGSLETVIPVVSSHPIKTMNVYHPSRLSPRQKYFVTTHTESVCSNERDFYPSWKEADKRTIWHKLNKEAMADWDRIFIKDRTSPVRETYLYGNADRSKYDVNSMASCFRFVRNFFNHVNTRVEEMRGRGMNIELLTLEDKGSLVYSLFPTLFEKLFYFYDLESEINTLMMLDVSSERKWTSSPDDNSNYNDKFVIVSYNILGVENVGKHPELYAKPEYLNWESRKELLCVELKRYQSGILCFQEVDHFDELNDLLKKDGFKGTHKARTRDDGDDACVGCSVFWKTNLFTLLEESNIEFQSLKLRNNVAQFCVLEMNTPSRQRLLVGNIHVLYNPHRGDIKLGQMRFFFEKAHELSDSWGGIPVVLAGDLNSLPQSAMYTFLASSMLDIQQHHRSQISGQLPQSPLVPQWTSEDRERATGSKEGRYVRHNLKLSSAYKDVPGSEIYRDSHGEPVATSHHNRFTGTVDYIWHTPEIVALKVLETLSMQRLKETGGLPAERWGSDHLALACEFAFTDDAE